jgi:hypothetical protein
VRDRDRRLHVARSRCAESARTRVPTFFSFGLRACTKCSQHDAPLRAPASSKRSTPVLKEHPPDLTSLRSDGVRLSLNAVFRRLPRKKAPEGRFQSRARPRVRAREPGLGIGTDRRCPRLLRPYAAPAELAIVIVAAVALLSIGTAMVVDRTARTSRRRTPLEDPGAEAPPLLAVLRSRTSRHQRGFFCTGHDARGHQPVVKAQRAARGRQ